MTKYVSKILITPQWVRFGFDPRKEPSSAQYQTLDYRVRLQGGARHKVKAKRSYANYLLPYKATNFSKPKTSLIDRETFNVIANKTEAAAGASSSASAADAAAAGATTAVSESDLAKAESAKDVYMFRPGRIPLYRQMFYHFKDLDVQEAREVIRANLRTSSTSSLVCDEKNGWFSPGTDNKLREVLTRHISSHLAKERNREEEEDAESVVTNVTANQEDGFLPEEEEFSSDSDEGILETAELQKEVLKNIVTGD